MAGGVDGPLDDLVCLEQPIASGLEAFDLIAYTTTTLFEILEQLLAVVSGLDQQHPTLLLGFGDDAFTLEPALGHLVVHRRNPASGFGIGLGGALVEHCLSRSQNLRRPFLGIGHERLGSGLAVRRQSLGLLTSRGQRRVGLLTSRGQRRVGLLTSRGQRRVGLLTTRGGQTLGLGLGFGQACGGRLPRHVEDRGRFGSESLGERVLVDLGRIDELRVELGDRCPQAVLGAVRSAQRRRQITKELTDLALVEAAAHHIERRVGDLVGVEARLRSLSGGRFDHGTIVSGGF